MVQSSSKLARTFDPPLAQEAGNSAASLGQSLLQSIGNTPLLRLDAVTADLPGIELLGKAEWYQPRWFRERPRRRQHCHPGPPQREVRCRQNAARCHQRQYRHCLCHDGRGGGFSCDSLHAGKCFPRAQTDSACLRRQHCLHRSGRRLRRRHPHGSGVVRASIRTNISMPTSIPTMPTGRLTTMAQPTKSGNRRQGRITHFVSMMGTSGTFVGTTRRLKELNPKIRCISLQPDSPSTASKARSTWPARWSRRFTIPRSPTKISDFDRRLLCHGRHLAREEGLAGRRLRGRGGGRVSANRAPAASKRSSRGICDHSVRLRRQIFEREILDRSE